MEELLSQDEIDELLKRLESNFTSIIHIRPREIEQIDDISEREEKREDFELANEAFIRPLEILLNKHLSEKNGINYNYDLGDQSIIQRIVDLRNQLLLSGFDQTYLNALVPRNVSEVSALVEAFKKGYKDDGVLLNKDRVTSAKNYVEMNNDISSFGPSF